jgi:hypothetical protein
MKPTHQISIRKTIALVAGIAALAVPATATAFPVIGDDPATAQSQAEGHAWYANYLKRQAKRSKPSSKPITLCPGKTVCRKP